MGPEPQQECAMHDANDPLLVGRSFPAEHSWTLTHSRHALRFDCVTPGSEKYYYISVSHHRGCIVTIVLWVVQGPIRLQQMDGIARMHNLV